MESSINNLKEKYWEGKSSLDDERQLKRIISESDASKSEIEYFEFLMKKGNEKSPVSFKHPAKKSGKRFYMQIAAGILLILSTTFYLLKPEPQDPFLVKDPQQALLITQNALAMVSGNMKKGKKYVNELNEIEKAKDIFFNEINLNE